MASVVARVTSGFGFPLMYRRHNNGCKSGITVLFARSWHPNETMVDFHEACFWKLAVIQAKYIIINKKFCEELIAYIPWYDTNRIEKRRAQKFFFCCMCVRCLSNVLTEPLPSNNRGYTYRHTDWWDIFMNYAVEIGWGDVHVLSLININSGIPKIDRGCTDTDSIVIA
jgi:hypothetical protein